MKIPSYHNAPKIIKHRMYPLTREEEAYIRQFLKEEQKKGHIYLEAPPIAFPASTKGKKGTGRERITVNDGQASRNTTQDNNAAVDIYGIARLLTGKKLFSKFNVHRKCKGARVVGKDTHRTAFKDTKAPPRVGQVLRDDFSEILQKYPNETFHYRDNFIVATKETPEGLAQHQQICHEVLDLMEKHLYSLQLSQCKFKQPKMDILGWLVEDGNITNDPAKVAEITTWSKELRDVKDVQSVLKELEHQKPFIWEFVRIAKPLHELAKGKTPFKWTQECTDALNELVNIITNKPMLACLDLSKPFELEADASPYAVGMTLFQRDGNQQRKNMGYFSRALSLGCRSPTQDEELLAIVTGLHIWRHLLAESPHKVIVWTDHTNPQNDRHPQKGNSGVTRYVACYDP
jgi:hypothetical protein